MKRRERERLGEDRFPLSGYSTAGARNLSLGRNPQLPGKISVRFSLSGLLARSLQHQHATRRQNH
jgi:hypothetical protein